MAELPAVGNPAPTPRAAHRVRARFAVLLLLIPAAAGAQELEPRALTNVPVGTNFVLLGYGYATGNTLLDPSVPVEDLNSRVHSLLGAYVRSISLFGLSSKLDVVVPFASGDWKGQLAGVDTSRAVTGMGDPRVRLSLNFVGAPALRGAEFREYRQKTIVGTSLQVVVPLGQYDPSKLINLGTNRWTVRAQLGASHRVGPWFLEGYVSGWFFTANSDFYGGVRRTQHPLFGFKLHFIRSLGRRVWIGIEGGYGVGGRSVIDGVETDTQISTFRFGATGAWRVAARHTLRLILGSGARVLRGSDFEAVSLLYQYRW